MPPGAATSLPGQVPGQEKRHRQQGQQKNEQDPAGIFMEAEILYEIFGDLQYDPAAADENHKGLENGVLDKSFESVGLVSHAWWVMLTCNLVSYRL